MHRGFMSHTLELLKMDAMSLFGRYIFVAA